MELQTDGPAGFKAVPFIKHRCGFTIATAQENHGLRARPAPMALRGFWTVPALVTTNQALSRQVPLLSFADGEPAKAALPPFMITGA
jgi:hypothetical protein